MTNFEICAECYKEHFPVYKDMEIKVSFREHKCCGCGEMKQTVKKVIAGGKVVDIN